MGWEEKPLDPAGTLCPQRAVLEKFHPNHWVSLPGTPTHIQGTVGPTAHLLCHQGAGQDWGWGGQTGALRLPGPGAGLEQVVGFTEVGRGGWAAVAQAGTMGVPLPPLLRTVALWERGPQSPGSRPVPPSPLSCSILPEARSGLASLRHSLVAQAGWMAGSGPQLTSQCRAEGGSFRAGAGTRSSAS